MTTATRRRWEWELNAAGLDRDLVKHVLIERGLIRTSTSELSPADVTLTLRAFRARNLTIIPDRKAAGAPPTRSTRRTAARKAPPDMTPVGRARAYYHERYRSALDCAPPWNYGQDDKLLARLIKQHGEATIHLAIERITDPDLAHKFVATSDRSMRVLYTCFEEIVPEAAEDAAQRMEGIHDRIRM